MHSTAQETVTKEKEIQEGKMAVWEALTVQLRKEENQKAKEKENDIPPLNAEFQSIARRENKVFLSEQCKEIEENNRMGKTRDLFKKIRDNNQTFHATMGTIKDKNGKDLIGAEGIKKSWQEYTEERYQKVLNDWDNHNGMVTHLEPDILEYAVINKASGGDEIPSKLF